MNSIRKKIEAIVPVHALLLIAAMLGLNFVTYFGTRLFTTGRYHYNIETALDRMLPVVPFFTVFYLLAFAQWITCYLLIGRGGRAHYCRFYYGEMIAKCICLVIFLVFPTTLNQPAVTGNGIFEQLLRFVYSMDKPDNLFPSIHCLESWLCYRGCRKLSGLPRAFSGCNLLFTLLVFASTVLLKQHVLIDIAGGVAAVEIGLFLSGRILRKDGAR